MQIDLILAPMGVLAALTFAVLGLVPLARFRATGAKHVTADDFKYGESARVPPGTSIPNRNYMNLLELPVLFYVICLMIYVTGRLTELQLGLAWAYVGLRALHSGVHLTLNIVMIRLSLFAMSNLVLMIMWLVFFFGPRPGG
ncbi:MAG: MAPEG family protein [Hyphomonas sp.]|uniref:MAPEG family protein n=1 Tax=Hyphomonas sp. TaxID=87 RepID=UPI003527D821